MKKNSENNKSIFKTVSFVTTFLFLTLLLSPMSAFAAGKTLSTLVTETIIPYINTGIYLIIALAVVTFVWNVYRYFFTEKEKKEAGMYVLYSTIGFFVILSFWGLVAILSNSLNLPQGAMGWPFGGSSINAPVGTGGTGNTPMTSSNNNAFNPQPSGNTPNTSSDRLPTVRDVRGDSGTGQIR
ncbi:MAG TPA: pilin [Candidatus Paceibacterota bacterium]